MGGSGRRKAHDWWRQLQILLVPCSVDGSGPTHTSAPTVGVAGIVLWFFQVLLLAGPLRR